MQQAFSLFFPPEIMGSHVGPRRCPVTRRSHTVFFKAVTALFGSFGIEADLRELNAGERTELAQFITLYRQHRDWMHQGQLQYLGMPEDDWVVCCNMSMDRRRALISAAMTTVPRHPVPDALRVPGLDNAIDYQVRMIVPAIDGFVKQQPLLINGDWMQVSASLLANVGIALPALPPESAMLIEIQPATGT